MHLFYTPDISSNPELPEEESLHCAKVLRLTAGTPLILIDGKGGMFKAELTMPHHKRSQVKILEKIEWKKPWSGKIELVIAPTKNMDRMEWLVEKITEIGIDSIVPIRVYHSERKEIKQERLEKIAISAMKQSKKAFLPEIHPLVDFKTHLEKPFDGERYIAHCEEGMERILLSRTYNKQSSGVQIWIGPEGDFSPPEIQQAIERGVTPITLGESRLRTETAALAACHTIHVIQSI